MAFTFTFKNFFNHFIKNQHLPCCKVLLSLQHNILCIIIDLGIVTPVKKFKLTFIQKSLILFLGILVLILSFNYISYTELLELTMFFILGKKSTSICSPISLLIPVRNMIKKTASSFQV